MSDNLDSLRKEIAPYIEKNSFRGADRKLIMKAFEAWRDNRMPRKEFMDRLGINRYHLAAIARLARRMLQNRPRTYRRGVKESSQSFSEVKIVKPVRQSKLVSTSASGIRVELFL